jgi:hypothetical protein
MALGKGSSRWNPWGVAKIGVVTAGGGAMIGGGSANDGVAGAGGARRGGWRGIFNS